MLRHCEVLICLLTLCQGTKNVRFLANQTAESVNIGGEYTWMSNYTEKCEIKTLNVYSPAKFHKNFTQHCTFLKEICFFGFNFRCGSSAEYYNSLREELGKTNITLRTVNTSCNKVPLDCYLEKNLDFFKQIDCQEALSNKKNRTKTCIVKHLSPYHLVVFCRNIGLKNEDLPMHLPENTTTLVITHNQELTDISPLMEKVMNLHKLTIGQFAYNAIEKLPLLPNAEGRVRSFTFSFSHNKINTLDVNTLESYLAFKEVRLTLRNNTLKCDCGLEHVLKSMPTKLPNLVQDIFYIFCDGENKVKTRPWDVDYSNCVRIQVDPFDILIGAIGLVITCLGVVYWNLNKAVGRLDKGESDVPTPWIHAFFTLVGNHWSSFKNFTFGKKCNQLKK